jgi:hypothetical protein
MAGTLYIRVKITASVPRLHVDATGVFNAFNPFVDGMPSATLITAKGEM